MGSDISAEVFIKSKVCYPGNVLQGHVALKVDNPTKCYSARIAARGVETTKAIRGAGQNSCGIKEETPFFRDMVTLFGEGSRSDIAHEVTLMKGVYVYPFSFVLPMNLPGTIELTSWHSGGVMIDYFVDAMIELQPNDYKIFTEKFTVACPINAKELQRPGPSASAEAQLSRFFSHRGTCQFTVTAKRAFFAGGGDSLMATVSIDNSQGEIPIHEVDVELQCLVSCHVMDEVMGFKNDTEGKARGDKIVQQTVKCDIAAHGTGDVDLSCPLPVIIPYPSYPAKGTRYVIRHVLSVSIEGTSAAVSLNLAHSADKENRFHFFDNETNAQEPKVFTGKAYVPELHSGCQPIHGVLPSDALPKETEAVATTPQANGTRPQLA